MTITPVFHLDQTHDDVVVTIRVPYVRVSGGAARFHAGGDGGTEFHFYCRPYLLRLDLPHPVVAVDDGSDDEDDDGDDGGDFGHCGSGSGGGGDGGAGFGPRRRPLVEELDGGGGDSSSGASEEKVVPGPTAGGATATYDPDLNHGTLTVRLPKVTPGLHFPDLDMLTKLLLRRRTQDDDDAPLTKEEIRRRIDGYDDDAHRNSSQRRRPSGSKITVLDETVADDDPAVDPSANGDTGLDDCDDPHGGGDTTHAADLLNSLAPSYGFANGHRSVFRDLREEVRTFVELPDPDGTDPALRRGLRLEAEEGKFDPDRYLGDLFLGQEEDGVDTDMVYAQAVGLAPHWERRRRHTTTTAAESSRTVSPDEAVAEGGDGGGGDGDCGASIEVITERLARLDATDPVTVAGKDRSGEVVASKIPADEHDGDDDDDPSAPFFTEGELAELTKIRPPRTHRGPLLPSPTSEEEELTDSHLLGLLDVLFAYAYDHRTTGGDDGGNCESAWTIATLSPTLSWFESYHPRPRRRGRGGRFFRGSYGEEVTGESSLEVGRGDAEGDDEEQRDGDGPADVLRYCVRRSLVYPYVRNLDFAVNVVVRDVLRIISLGRRTVLRCLLQVRRIFERTDTHYLLNMLYVDEYCVWVQKELTEEDLAEFAHAAREDVLLSGRDDCRCEVVTSQMDKCDVGGTRITKDSIGLNLKELERLAFGEWTEEEEEEEEECSSCASSYDDASTTSSDGDDEGCSSRSGADAEDGTSRCSESSRSAGLIADGATTGNEESLPPTPLPDLLRSQPDDSVRESSQREGGMDTEGISTQTKRSLIEELT